MFMVAWRDITLAITDEAWPHLTVGQGVSGARDLVGARDSKVNYADRATPMFTPNEIGQFFLMLIWIFSVSVLANSCYNLAILRVKKTSTRKQAIFYTIIIFTSLIIALENGSKLVWAGLFEESISILLEELLLKQKRMFPLAIQSEIYMLLGLGTNILVKYLGEVGERIWYHDEAAAVA
ncbi:hypothetical protein Tco_1437201 [Tanacetum coccineum]